MFYKCYDEVIFNIISRPICNFNNFLIVFLFFSYTLHQIKHPFHIHSPNKEVPLSFHQAVHRTDHSKHRADIRCQIPIYLTVILCTKASL